MEQSVLPRAAMGRAILPATALILPPLAIFAPLGAAPLLAIAALAAVVFEAPRLAAQLAVPRPPILLLGALGIWAAISASWSILPQHSLLEGLRFLGLSAGGLVLVTRACALTADERRLIRAALIMGVIAGLLFLALERFANAPLTRFWLRLPADQYLGLSRYDRGVTVLVLALWPAFFAIQWKTGRGLLILAVVAAAAIMVSTTALLAVLVALGVFAVAWFTPRIVAGTMILGTLVLGIAIPLATPTNDRIVALHERAPWIKWSGIHRLAIWRFAADRVAERPLLGWGMDAARGIPGGKTDISAVMPALHFPGGAELLPLHPHDAALQLQLELGLPGLALGLGFIAWALGWLGWRSSTPLGRGHRAGALALSASALTVGMLSFGLWQAWWLSTLWLVVALYIATADDLV